eukprot:GHVS01061335.1.p1 GENE.GHVS01061335.1~~GHVS01061335.1.p1  ORF type:complete len:514 (-),score=118.29 GHVS01061335.1:1949-3406(-)
MRPTASSFQTNHLQTEAIPPTSTTTTTNAVVLGGAVAIELADLQPSSNARGDSCAASSSPRLHSSPADAASLASVLVSGLAVCAVMSCALYLFQYGCQLLHAYAPLAVALKYLELLGPLTSIMLYVSPAMSVVQSAMNGKHQSLPVKMFVVQGVSNVLAIDYGLKVKQPAIYLTNSAGLFIQLLWLTVYNYICLTNKRRVASCLNEVSSSSSSTTTTPSNTSTTTTTTARPPLPPPKAAPLSAVHVGPKSSTKRLHSFLSGRLPRRVGVKALLLQLSVGEDGKGWFAFLLTLACFISALLYFSSLFGAETVGVACTISNLMLFSVPLSSTGTMIRNRSSDSLPMAMNLMMILCSVVWGIYGYLLKDAVVYVPSLIGYLMALFQLLVVLWCRGLLPKQIDMAALFSLMLNTRPSHVGQKASWTNTERYYDCCPDTTPKVLDDVALNSAGRWRSCASGASGTTDHPSTLTNVSLAKQASASLGAFSV